MQHRFVLSLAGSLIALFPAAATLADTVTTTTGGVVNGTVLKIEGGRLQMQSSSGNATERSMDQVAKIIADGETALNEAEEAFAAKKFDVAAAAYDRALTSSRKDWVKTRAIDRLLIAAEEARQFHLSAAAFAQVAIRDPNAGDRKPVVPADKAQVAKAIPAVERVFNTKQNDVLRGFLAELYLANDQLDKANALLAAAGPGARTGPLVVMQAKAAYAAKNYAGAINAIEQNRAVITQPDQQIDALYTVAQSRYALSGTDPAKKMDAAIAYIRVAAHFADRRDPRVVDSLMKAAALMEQAGLAAEAGTLYGQIAVDPRAKGTAFETEAKTKAEQLKAAAAAASQPK